ncbi:MAG: hypothetical protein HY678_04335, partial [Chloroflexi bacterium]|nr:hypothetical protein [Chloroflexota bacterium]
MTPSQTAPTPLSMAGDTLVFFVACTTPHHTRSPAFTYDVLGNLTQVAVDPQLDAGLLNATTTMTYDWLG